MRTPAHNHTLRGEKDLDTSPDGLPEVPSTKCNCTRDNLGSQSVPADEDREKAAHGTRYRGDETGQHWEIDFTEVRPGKYGYLLVLVDTFSGKVEAFPTK